MFSVGTERGFNAVAPYYSRIRSVCYGQSMKRIQTMRTFDESGTNHLIVGDGCGDLCVHLLTENDNAQATALDISAEMLQRLKMRMQETPDRLKRVTAIRADFFTFSQVHAFDVIHFPFFFDLWNDERIEQTLNELRINCHPGVKLHVVDYNPQMLTLKDKALVPLLYLFFNRITKTNRYQVPELQLLADKAGWSVVDKLEQAPFISLLLE